MATADLRSYLSGVSQNDNSSKNQKYEINSFIEIAKYEKTDDDVIESKSLLIFPSFTKLHTTYAAPTQQSQITGDPIVLYTDNNDIFSPGDTILVLGVSGYEPDGGISRRELMLYVKAVDRDGGGVTVESINGKKIGTATNQVPSISSGTTLIRCGRSREKMNEDGVDDEIYYSEDPNSYYNYIQNFCISIDESAEERVLKDGLITSTSKMSEYEKLQLNAYILSRESSFLYGVGSENYYTTLGIWYQAGKTFNYDEDSLTQESVINMLRDAFTSYNNLNVGRKYKILIGGSGLISLLNKLNYTKVVYNKNITNWGICFGYIYSNFGTVKILCSTIFDNVGMPDNGIIIDPQYIKYMVKSPLSASYDEENEMLIISEESALVLSEPEAHMRIVMQ